MKKYNLILVYDQNKEKVLMCKREKNPYKGTLNLVGGKIEDGETEIESAYRELEEETGIEKNNIELKSLMKFEYATQETTMVVFAGKLKTNVNLIEEVNKLVWVDINEDFYDLKKYAGEGNIWHMIHHANNYLEI